MQQATCHHTAAFHPGQGVQGAKRHASELAAPSSRYDLKSYNTLPPAAAAQTHRCMHVRLLRTNRQSKWNSDAVAHNHVQRKHYAPMPPTVFIMHHVQPNHRYLHIVVLHPA
jgi:hypothetical protein